jgi:cardiolipin synthase
VTLPTFITLARLLAVPVIVWAIASGEMALAFAIFVLAGASDALDGYLARRLNAHSALGAYLDPVADKALMISIYVTLGLEGHLPRWLVILVVSRDLLIMGAVVVSRLVDRPVEIRPLIVSKANTVAQILLAAVVLAALGPGIVVPYLVPALTAAVGVLTLGSAAAYLRDWVLHMSGPDRPAA